MSAENITQAIEAAISFFHQIYADDDLKNILLEEVREKDDDTWEVTIGYSQVVQDSPVMQAITQGAKYERVYKVLTVDKDSGEVNSMLLRSV